MKFKVTCFLLIVCLFSFSSVVLGQDSSQASDLKPSVSNLSKDDIIKKVETRYTLPGFSANFFQVSTIKAMKITDTAYGKAFFKRPDKMRWEYEKPDRQTIIEKTFDVSVIYLSVSKKTFEVVKIVTYNSYGDETRIELSDIQFKQKLDDSMFSFKIPQGVEVLHLDEQ